MPFPDGVYAASLTPLDATLAIDAGALAAHVHGLLARGCDGVALFGSTGEAPSFAVAERQAALDAVLEAGVPPKRLLVGTGCAALPDTVALTRHAAGHGVGGVLMLPPFFYKGVTDEGVFASIDAVVQRLGSDVPPVVLYHFPQQAGVGFSMDVLERLRQRYPDHIVGMKDSSGDVAHMRRVLTAFPGFRLFAGTERYLLDVLRAGGAGCISATTNVTAPLAAELYARAETPEADRLQTHLAEVRGAFEGLPFVPALKGLLARWQDAPGWHAMRPPLVPLAPSALDALEAALGALDATPARLL